MGTMCRWRGVPSVGDMTWSQLHERMAFMADLIEQAAVDVEGALGFNGDLSEVERLFGSVDGLLLALQQRWTTMLTAKLDQAVHDDIPVDRVRAELGSRQPGLRALLDAGALRSVRVHAIQRGEQRILDYYGRSSEGRLTVA